MMIVSSQHHIDWSIVEEKMESLAGAEYVEIPCWYIGEVNGTEMAIQSDKHHTMAAARELGIEIRYIMMDEPEGLSGTEALESHYNDGDWYDVETSNPAYDEFNFIW